MLKKMIIALGVAVSVLSLIGCSAESLNSNPAHPDPAHPDHVEGIVTEKEDYVVISTKNNHEAYYLTIKTEDGTKYKVRVTSVTFQQYNEGDKFNSYKHTRNFQSNLISKLEDNKN